MKLVVSIVLIFISSLNIKAADGLILIKLNDLFIHYKSDYERMQKTGFALSDCLYLDKFLFNRIKKEFPGYLERKSISISDFDKTFYDNRRYSQDFFSNKLYKKYSTIYDVVKANDNGLYKVPNMGIIKGYYMQQKVLYYKNKLLIIYRHKDYSLMRAYCVQLDKPDLLVFRIAYSIDD